MRKRSKYRPRDVRIDAVGWVLSGLKPLASIKEEHQLLVSKNHAAMNEITQGRGTREHIDVLIAALNMTEGLYRVRATLGQDWAPEIRSGQDALLAMTRRGVERGDRFVFTGPAFVAINLALEIYDQQLNQCTVAELEAAIQIAKREIHLKRARLIKEEKEKALCGS